MKRISALLLTLVMLFTLTACGGGSNPPAQENTPPAQADGDKQDTPAPAPADDANLTETQKIIKEAEGMSLEELAKKAIEESNGKMFYGVGNSSRGKSALPLFIEYLQSIDSSYNMEFEWQQPKNNKIFDQLTADS